MSPRAAEIVPKRTIPENPQVRSGLDAHGDHPAAGSGQSQLPRDAGAAQLAADRALNNLQFFGKSPESSLPNLGRSVLDRIEFDFCKHIFVFIRFPAFFDIRKICTFLYPGEPDLCWGIRRGDRAWPLVPTLAVCVRVDVGCADFSLQILSTPLKSREVNEIRRLDCTNRPVS